MPVVRNNDRADQLTHSASGKKLIKWTSRGAAGNKLKALLSKPEHENKTGVEIYDDPVIGKQWSDVYLRKSFCTGVTNMKRLTLNAELMASVQNSGADGT